MPPSTTITHLLVDTVNISREQEINMGSGRWQSNPVVFAAGVRFRVFTASAKDLALAQQIRMDMSHTGYCEPDQDITTGDMVDLLTKEGVPVVGQSFIVSGVMDPSLIHHRKLALKQVQQAK